MRRGSRVLAAALATGVAALVGCGAETSAPDEGEGAVEAPEPRDPSAEPAQGATEGTPSSAEPAPASPEACERAQACCPAYVSALPRAARTEAAEACETLALAMQLEGQPRDEACQGALDGFRAALREGGVELPADCR